MGSLISMAEVAEGVKKLFSGRVLGMENMPPGFLNALDVVGLTRFCNVAWTSGGVTMDWQTEVVFTQKGVLGGDHTPQPSWQGLYRGTGEEGTSDSRTSGRGNVVFVLDHLYTLSRVFEGGWKFAQPVHMCVVDLEKAFDRL